MPSMICWSPNSNGIVANGSSDLRCVSRIVATPTANNAVPAMKLADAEKHMIPSSFSGQCCGAGETVCELIRPAVKVLIFTRFNSSALATTIKVEPDIDRAATSGLNSHPVNG